MREKEWTVFGAALDPLDAPEKVEMKAAYLKAVGRGALKPSHPRDPYDLISPQVEQVDAARISRAGKLEVDDWLRPRPAPRSLPAMRKERFTAFLDSDGCRRYAGMVGDYINSEVLPRRPLMIGVDHSLSGGAIRALAERYGPDRLAVVVLDAHSDILSLQRRMELYSLLESEGRGLDTAGSQGANRTAAVPDSYNCGSFLHFLVEEGAVEPAGLLLAGVADLPSCPGNAPVGGAAEAVLAPFAGLEEKGAAFLGKGELREADGPARLRKALERFEDRVVYVSLDIDVGALEAAHACRFMDLFGTGERELLAACDVIGGWLDEREGRLAGLDLMEMDVHLAGLRHDDGTRDQTARLAVRMLSRLL